MNKKICAVGARKPPKIGYDELAVKLHSNYSRELFRLSAICGQTEGLVITLRTELY